MPTKETYFQVTYERRNLLRFYDLLRDRKIIVGEPEPTVILGDYALQEIDESPDQVWDVDKFECVAPPFKHMFIEAESTTADVKLGVLIEVSDVDDRVQAVSRKNFGIEPAGRWAYFTTTIGLYGGRIASYEAVGLLLVDEDGGLLPRTFPQVPVSFPTPPPPAADTIGEFMTSALPFALKTLDLMNLVNVELETNYPPRHERRRRKRNNDHPPVEWKELVVRPSKKGDTINLSQKIESSGSNRAHVVRGHIKRRETGRFYWRPHIRGNPDRGEVNKTYRVEGDKGDENDEG